MSNRYASGKYALAICDKCSFEFPLKKLRTQTVKTHPYKIKVCNECWDADHPQLKVGMYPANDPQAIRDPRPDTSYPQSRAIQWGWAPVGGARGVDAGLTPNALVSKTYVGDVTISIA